MKIIDHSPTEWSQLVEAAPQSTVFHTNEWLALLARTYRAEVRRIGFVEGKRLIGGIPVIARRKFIYRLAGSPASGTATPYQGPIWFDPSSYESLFRALWSYAQSQWAFVEVTSPPGMLPDDCASSMPDIRCEIRRTVYLDLKAGEAELFRGMKKACRRCIRQAEERGVVVQEQKLSGSEWLQDYYRMSKQLYHRQGRPPAIPQAFFQNLIEVFGSSGKLKVLVARHNDVVVAASIFLTHKTTLYGLDAVSDHTYQCLRANNLIQWTIIRWACSQGLRIYDMVGANLPGIARFKKGFGGRFVQYSTFQQSNGRLARLGERGYRLLAPAARRVLSLLPT